MKQLPGDFTPDDMEGYKDYALDHIKHFNLIPFEYENYETGKSYNSDQCWKMAEYLSLPDLITD